MYKMTYRERIRQLSISALIIGLFVASCPAYSEWRDLGPVSKFFGQISQQCAYRLAWRGSLQPAGGSAKETAEFSYKYIYSGPDADETPIEATNMDVYVPGVLTLMFANADAIVETFDVLEEVNHKAPAKLRAHFVRGRSEDNFVIITPTWADVDHGDYFLKPSYFNLQKNCK